MAGDIGIILLSFGRALVLTLLIELTLAYIFGIRRRIEMVVVICVNTLTNPLVMLYYYVVTSIYPDVQGILLQIPVEIVVIIAEALIYRSYNKTADICFRHPVILSVTANLVSWGTGVILQYNI